MGKALAPPDVHCSRCHFSHLCRLLGVSSPDPALCQTVHQGIGCRHPTAEEFDEILDNGESRVQAGAATAQSGEAPIKPEDKNQIIERMPFQLTCEDSRERDFVNRAPVTESGKVFLDKIKRKKNRSLSPCGFHVNGEPI